MLTRAKYQLDRRRLRQVRKAIPDVTWRLPLAFCRNPGELVLSEGRNYKLFLVLLEANPILTMTPRDGCDMSVRFFVRWTEGTGQTEWTEDTNGTERGIILFIKDFCVLFYYPNICRSCIYVT